MMILNCEKFKERRKNQNLDGNIFPYKYFVGNPNLSEPSVVGDTVYLACRDDYESLIEKVQHGIRWILNTYPDIKYIFKTDDDVNYHFDNLNLVYKTIVQQNIPYGGLVVNKFPETSLFHKGKCSDSSLDHVSYQLERCYYCAGPAYFVSKSSAEIMLSEKNFKTIYEDYEFGYLLNRRGIYPSNLRIHNFSCFWL
jgi:hypothetical protein